MTPDYYTLAIDPGASGGIAHGLLLGSPVLEPMPATPHDLAERVKQIAHGADRPLQAYLEEVGGYVGGPGQPGAAMFKFGQSYGVLLGVFAALEIPVTLCRPQKWQKAMSLGTSTGMNKITWKNKLKARAQQLYPSCKVTLKTADALLIYHAAVKGVI